MKRAYAPLGRYFDPAVEAFSDLMLENPIRTSTELSFQLDNFVDNKRAIPATITLPDGRVVNGFALRRPEYLVQIELMHAMQGADVGAPTAPYIYMPDNGLLFTPAPFEGAKSFHDYMSDLQYSQTQQQVMQRVPADTLGALEPFARWVNKYDDNDCNRVYADKDGAVHVAMIDNPLFADNGLINLSLRRQITRGRAACRFGARGQKFHQARRTMIERIKTYPPKRARAIEALIAAGFKYPPHVAKRTISRRWTAEPVLGVY